MVRDFPQASLPRLQAALPGVVVPLAGANGALWC
jgi:hypothetical protein